MAYDITGIVNLALLDIGADPIDDIENTNLPNAIKVKSVWEYIRDEVLSEIDWRFAKTRAKLAQHTIEPLYGYSYAYALPSDFLRLAKTRYQSSKGLNPLAYAGGYWYQLIDATGYPRNLNFDPPVYPPGYHYIIEAIPDTGIQCLLTDYDNSAYDLYINYIQKVSDATRYTAKFIQALAKRLAAQLAIAISEDRPKSATMMELYYLAISSAKALNESFDYVEDEAGSSAWKDAGR